MAYCEKCGASLSKEAQFCPSCGTPVTHTGKDVPGTQFGTTLNTGNLYGRLNLENLPEGHLIDDRYEIIRKLGQGSFGAVYLAYDNHMEIRKALKIIPEAVTNDREAMLSLKKEASIMVKLNHTNIVHVYDFHYDNEIKYIDMEYVDGKSLADLKLEKKDKKFPEEEVKQYALQIAEGLAYAHNQKVIHKDIKPQNIMLTKDGTIKLMDFGIAETVHSSMSRLKNTGSSGTLVYMSPEQLRGKDVGKESDIYSLGATLYELLTGNPPFYQGDITYQIINEAPRSVSGVSEQMNGVLTKCLEKDLRKRFGNCKELLKVFLNKNDSIYIKEKFPSIESHNIQKKETSRLYSVDMELVEGGTFNMGGEINSFWSQKHSVILDNFYISRYEITQKIWTEVMGKNPSFFNLNEVNPVECVSWLDIQEFIKKLNHITNKNYRLPSEAEWEFAARGGKKSKGLIYSGSNDINEVAWYWRNSQRETHPVGQKKPNELNLFDMCGNVSEWCNDWYGRYVYQTETNPKGPKSGNWRIYRGGNWARGSRYSRVIYRESIYPHRIISNIGFRLAHNAEK